MTDHTNGDQDATKPKRYVIVDHNGHAVNVSDTSAMFPALLAALPLGGRFTVTRVQ